MQPVALRWQFVNSQHRGRPEVRWSIYGALVGACVGWLFVGGIGIAARGNAFGMSAWIILAIAGFAAGNRYGVEKDKAVLVKKVSH